MDASACTHLQRAFHSTTPDKIRAHLSHFGLNQDKVDVAVHKLSGGEKARLALALICHNKPQILIFDEPTNHLDIETREALAMALNAYNGAVILISHDWYFLQLTADRLWVVGNQTVKSYPDTLQDYRQQVLGIEARAGKKSKK